jgi:hypothetical protein
VAELRGEDEVIKEKSLRKNGVMARYDGVDGNVCNIK